MERIVEVTAARAGGPVPVGIMNIRQALELPNRADFRYRHTPAGTSIAKPITRRELEELAKR